MDETMDMEVRFRTRKFLFAISMFAAATLLLIGGQISDVIWQNMSMFVGGGYFFANVAEKKVLK
jgi:hypothetical protein